MPRLIGQTDEFQNVVWELNQPQITLGRLEDNAVQIEHSSISGQHAMLVLDADDYKVVDQDSTNGTRVNGERISEQKLRRNDMVRFGNIEVLYDSEYSPPAQALPEPSQRVVLAPGNASQGKPADFKNVSPFPKANLADKSPLKLAVTILFILAIAALGYFAYAVFGPMFLG